MRVRFLPLLLLFACSGPAEYRRGTMPVPPPAPPRPGVGAPVMGQPGSFSEPLPRSPNSRVLPPSKEPGLWAGDEPRASRKREPGKPELLGVQLPLLPVSEGKAEAGFAFTCVDFWSRALPGTDLAEKVNALRPAEKRCMVAHMNNICVRIIEQMDDNESKDGVVTLIVRRHLAALRKAANEFVRAECGGGRLTETQQRLLGRLTDALYGSLHSRE